MSNINDQLILIAGESGTGKSASLMQLPNHERVIYLNTEAGKRLPFRNNFKSFTITDPYQVMEAFQTFNGKPDVDVIVIDTLTFLMDMMETRYVLGAKDTQKAWGDYAQFFKRLMQEYVALSDKSVIFLAHTRADYDEKSMEMRVSVPVKGSLKNNGIEAYFSTVVATKKMALSDLEPYPNDLLHITDQDRMLGFKHVFQTQLTPRTLGERIRSPMSLFTREQTYIDNNAGMLLNHIKAFYA